MWGGGLDAKLASRRGLAPGVAIAQCRRAGLFNVPFRRETTRRRIR